MIYSLCIYYLGASLSDHNMYRLLYAIGTSVKRKG